MEPALTPARLTSLRRFLERGERQIVTPTTPTLLRAHYLALDERQSNAKDLRMLLWLRTIQNDL